MHDDIRNARIRERAYQLFLNRTRTRFAFGDANADWLRAELEIDVEDRLLRRTPAYANRGSRDRVLCRAFGQST